MTSDILEGHAPPLWMRNRMEALRRRYDVDRAPSGRPAMWTEGAEEAICPYCEWPIREDGSCEAGCSAGLITVAPGIDRKVVP